MTKANLFSKQLVSATLALSLLTSACGEKKQEAKGPQAVPVKLQTVTTATLIDSKDFVGTLEARQRVNVAPRVESRITRILVTEGERVRRGQILVELEATKQQDDVNAAAANVNVTKAQLGESQAQYQAAEAERAQTQAEVGRSRAEVATAEANIEDAKAELVLAQVDYKRAKFLVEQGVQGQQELDQKTSDLKTKQAQLQAQIKTRDAARQSLKASEKSLLAAGKQVEQQLANIDSQRASISQAQAQLGSVSQDLDYNTVRAPIDGIVGDFNARKVGDFVQAGNEITTITNDQTFLLNTNIPKEYSPRLRIGLPVEIINPDGSVEVRGRVTYIAPLIGQNAQAILTKVTFNNDGSLRDKQYVKVRVIWDKKPGVLIPTTAVTSLGAKNFVFVATPEQSKEGKSTLVAKQKPIKVGKIQEQAYQVLSGVKAGDRIAVSQILNLKDGTQITEESLTTERTVEQ